MDKTRTLNLIAAEEGFRATPYLCSRGKRTIGYGYNLDARGNPDWWDGVTPWTEAQARQQLEDDFASVCLELDHLWPEWRDLSDARQAVCVSAVFQLGLASVKKFRNTIAALKAGDYELAAHRLLDSLWARQTPKRVQRNAVMLRTGEFVREVNGREI